MSHSSQDIRIGVDLGGHSIALGLVELPRIIKKIDIATPQSRSVFDVTDAIACGIAELLEGQSPENLSFVGIGVPAMLDKDRAMIKKAPNFPSPDWVDFRPAQALEAALRAKIPRLSHDFKVAIENDANVYALGEGAAGAAVGCLNYAVLTLGTGIGGGIVVNGSLVTGAHGMGGEPGHIWVGGDLPCGCGGAGHLETIAAADGIEARAAKAGLRGDFKLLWQTRADKSSAQSAAAEMCLEPFLEALSGAIASITQLLDLEMIILGGGISKAHLVADEIKNRTLPKLAAPYREYLNIKISSLGADAPLFGAVSLKH